LLAALREFSRVLTSYLQGWAMTNVSELIFVGIDVSKATLEVALDDSAKTQCFANTADGVAALLGMLGALDKKVAVVLLEATGGLEQRAVLALCLGGFAVMVVNPRQAHDFAKALGHLAKTDSTDAKALSHFARTLYASERRERLLYKLPTPEQEQLLAALTRRAQLVGMRVAETNRRHTAHASQAKSIGSIIKALDREISQIDKDIAQRLKAHFKDKLNLLKGLKGVGKGTQAVLMAALPELGSLSQREIAKLAGVAPLNCDSGKFKGKRATWGGRASVRTALYMATLSASRYDPVIAAFYQRLLAAGKAKKVALIACMHKLLTILNAVIKSGKPWQAGYPHVTQTHENA
jgi:transposase